MTSATTGAPAPRGVPARIAHGTLAARLLGADGPDLALFYGAAPGLAKGQLHPRAVGLYNLLHRCWGPIALVVVATLGWIPLGFFIGALAWALHISVDRALGYGLRTRDGFQRP
jgi:hypothetical protein